MVRQWAGKANLLRPPAAATTCIRGSITVCPAIVPVRHHTTPSCIYRHFLGLPDMIRTRCQWSVSVTGSRSLWIWDSYEEEWLYSVPKTEQIQLLCRGGGGTIANTEEVDGSGRLQVPEGCTIWTKEYRIWPMAEDLSRNLNLTWPGIKLEVAGPIELDSEGTRPEREELKEVIEELAGTGQADPRRDAAEWMAWDDLRIKWLKRKEENWQGNLWKYGIMTLMGCLLVGVTLTGVLRYWKKYASGRRKDAEIGDNADDTERVGEEPHRPCSHPERHEDLPSIFYPENFSTARRKL